MLPDLKNGWYCINGKGLFKYFDYKKGEADDAEQTMDEPYYETLAEKEMCIHSSTWFPLKQPQKT